ncbi:MAG: tryptophan synthase subunit alpha [Planctomycetota bacterium]
MSGSANGARVDRMVEHLRSEGRTGIMTHIVLGYPSLDESREIIAAMVEAGVDVIEVQIPFSDPTADGPVITQACQAALDNGVTVADAMAFMKEMSSKYETPFLYMSYTNIAFAYAGGPDAEDGGLRAFVRDSAAAGAAGMILPDLPPDQDQEGYTEACREFGLHPIYVVSPNTPDRRLEMIRDVSSGFVYSTSRTGTTGKEMDLEMDSLRSFLKRAHDITGLALAVGFSIRSREQVESLKDDAEIAVIGSHFIRVFEQGGIDALKSALAEVCKG